MIGMVQFITYQHTPLYQNGMVLFTTKHSGLLLVITTVPYGMQLCGLLLATTMELFGI